MTMLRAALERFQTLSMILRITVVACIALGIAAFLAPLLPGVPVSVNGVIYSRQELWQVGYAPSYLLIGLFMIAAGLGCLLRRKWSRTLLIVMPVAQLAPLVAAYLLWDAPSPFGQMSWQLYLVFCVTWALLAALYLHRSTAAREHYAA